MTGVKKDRKATILLVWLKRKNTAMMGLNLIDFL